MVQKAGRWWPPGFPGGPDVGAGVAGFRILRVLNQTVEARVREWYESLSVYHEGALGWVGGSARIEGREPDQEAIRDRLALIQEALEQLSGDADTFPCCWTYLICERET